MGCGGVMGSIRGMIWGVGVHREGTMPHRCEGGSGEGSQGDGWQRRGEDDNGVSGGEK